MEVAAATHDGRIRKSEQVCVERGGPCLGTLVDAEPPDTQLLPVPWNMVVGITNGTEMET